MLISSLALRECLTRFLLWIGFTAMYALRLRSSKWLFELHKNMFWNVILLDSFLFPKLIIKLPKPTEPQKIVRNWSTRDQKSNREKGILSTTESTILLCSILLYNTLFSVIIKVTVEIVLHKDAVAYFSFYDMVMMT